MGLVVTFSDMYVTDSYSRFDESGVIAQDQDRYTDNAKRMIDELLWMSETLRHGRENVPSTHHK